MMSNPPTPGQRVRITGLQARGDLNGSVGTAERFHPEKQRWEVHTARMGPHGREVVLVRPSNLILQEGGEKIMRAATEEETAAGLASLPIDLDPAKAKLLHQGSAAAADACEFAAACDE